MIEGGWIPGHIYKAELTEDSEALFACDGTTQPESVRTFNIVLEKTEVNDLKLNSCVKFIPKADVKNMSHSLDGLFQVALTQAGRQRRDAGGEGGG